MGRIAAGRTAGAMGAPTGQAARFAGGGTRGQTRRALDGAGPATAAARVEVAVGDRSGGRADILVLAAVALGLWNRSATIIAYFSGTPTASANRRHRREAEDRRPNRRHDRPTTVGPRSRRRSCSTRRTPTMPPASALSARRYGALEIGRAGGGQAARSRDPRRHRNSRRRRSRPAGRCGVTTTRHCRRATPSR